MAIDRRRLLLSSARLAAWWAVFDLGQVGRAWGDGRIDAPIIKFHQAVEKFA